MFTSFRKVEVKMQIKISTKRIFSFCSKLLTFCSCSHFPSVSPQTLPAVLCIFIFVHLCFCTYFVLSIKIHILKLLTFPLCVSSCHSRLHRKPCEFRSGDNRFSSSYLEKYNCIFDKLIFDRVLFSDALDLKKTYQY